MALAHSPKIITDGLVFHIDPANSKSYNSSENLLVASEAFAAWFKTNATITANTTTAPDKTITADKLVEDRTATTIHGAGVTQTLLANPYTYSLYAKKGERTWIRLSASGGFDAWFDLNNGVLGATTGALSATITSVGNGWFRCSITFTPTADTVSTNIRLASTDFNYTYTGDGTSGIYIWGAQLERGTTASKYTKTTTAAITRSTACLSLLNNQSLTLSSVGYSNNEFVLDGTSSYLLGSELSNLSGNNPWTIEFWANINSSENGGGRQGWLFWEGPNVQATNELLAIGISSGALEVAHWANDYVYTNALINFNQWAQYAVTFNGLTQAVYKNGTLVDSRSTTINLTVGNLYIGCRAPGAEFVKFNLGAFKIFNRALTALEVKQNFNAIRGRYGL